MSAPQEWLEMAKPHPEWEQTVQTVFQGHAPDIGQFPDIASLRQWITDSKTAMTALMPDIPGVKETDHQVKMRDGAEITCRVHAPETTPEGGSPLFVVYHGGGWCIGDLENEALLCKLAASKLGVTCVNVDYRLAPEYKFPTAVNDCIDATKWAAANAASIGASPNKGFLVGGTSAGGNLASTVAHQWRDEAISPPLTGVLYMIPFFIEHAYIPSHLKDLHASPEQNANAPILSQAAMDLFSGNYVTSESDRADPRFSTLLWPTGHKLLPPSAFMVCGMDPLRDDALIFEKMLREEEGIKTRLLTYPGVPHGFWSLAPMMELSKKFVADSVDCVKWLLEQRPVV